MCHPRLQQSSRVWLFWNDAWPGISIKPGSLYHTAYLKIVFLGTSSALPTRERGLSCTCIVREGQVLMFDAGEGAQTAYLKARLGWNRPMKIFITHMHGDHCIGLLGLLQSMSMRGRTKPLEIYGPMGVDEFVSANVRILRFGLAFPIMIRAVEEGEMLDGGSYAVSACRSAHAIESYAYRLQEKPKRRFSREKAMALGVPEGRLWGRLQRGEDVKAGGRVVKPDDVMGEPQRGKGIGISGDTRPTDELKSFFSECDWLVFDSTFADSLKQQALAKFHSTAREAAVLARDAGAVHLILTHFSARYDDVQQLVDEARSVHGSVLAAKDLMEIDV